MQFDDNSKRIGGAMLLAVVTLRDEVQGRNYRLPTNRDYAVVHAAQASLAKLPKGSVPHEPVNPVRPSPNARGVSAVTRYGIQSFGDLFTARQKLVLAGFAKAADAIPYSVTKEAVALAVSRLGNASTSLGRWHQTRENLEGMYSRQAIAFIWDFCEGNSLSDSTGGFTGALDWIAAVAETGNQASVGQVQRADACKSPLTNGTSDVWFTDPPYYDSIPYADLSDFFFIWLKRVLPDHPILNGHLDSQTGLTPKTEECVWNQSHLVDGRPKDGEFFEKTISRAFTESRRVLKHDGIGCVVFAHKTTEGWEALLSGLLNAGFVVTASWPITTEMATRTVARDSSALAGSVHLVCRPRPADAGVGDWSEVKSAMEKRIREWLPTLVKHGVRGADAIFSCLGPALESYSRYDKVLTAGDQEIPLGGDPDAIEPEKRGFLAYVFETLSKEALRQVLGDADTEGFEEDARMTALFLWTLQATKATGNGDKKPEVTEEDEEGDDDDEGKAKKAKAGFAMPFDTFIRITRPMGIHYAVLEHRVIEIEKGVVRLLPVRERSEQLLGEAATRPGVQISLEDVQQMELGLMVKRQEDSALLAKSKRGRRAAAGQQEGGKPVEEATFTTLDRIHRAMLLFSLGRSTLLRQVLEKELRQNKRFERLSLALNALYPDGSDERRMLEGVQAAMRGIK